MWLDLAKFRHFGKKSKPLKDYLVFDKIWSHWSLFVSAFFVAGDVYTSSKSFDWKREERERGRHLIGFVELAQQYFGFGKGSISLSLSLFNCLFHTHIFSITLHLVSNFFLCLRSLSFALFRFIVIVCLDFLSISLSVFVTLFLSFHSQKCFIYGRDRESRCNLTHGWRFSLIGNESMFTETGLTSFFQRGD